jgi:hypothetical protein
MECVICKQGFEGYGNNPDPVTTDGRCCDTCNLTVIIPERLRRLGIASRGEVRPGTAG